MASPQQSWKRVYRMEGLNVPETPVTCTILQELTFMAPLAYITLQCPYYFRKGFRAHPAEGKAGGSHKKQQFKRKPRGKKLGRRGEDDGARYRVREGGEKKPAVKIGVKRKTSAGMEGTKKQKR